MFLFLPFVEQAQRTDFETFLHDQQGWLADDYQSRGLDASHLMPIPDSIYPTPAEYITEQDTRRGFIDADGFMEDILENLGHASDGLTVRIAQYGPGTTDASLTLMEIVHPSDFQKRICLIVGIRCTRHFGSAQSAISTELRSNTWKQRPSTMADCEVLPSTKSRKISIPRLERSGS